MPVLGSALLAPPTARLTAELSGTPPIHQLATHDVLAAFLRASDPVMPADTLAGFDDRASVTLPTLRRYFR